MRRLFWCGLMLLLTLSLLALPVAADAPLETATETATEATTETATAVSLRDAWEERDWDALWAWFEAEVMPNLVTVIVVIGVGLVELLPACRSLVKAKRAFHKVATDVDAYTAAKIEYDTRAEEREKKFNARAEEREREMLQLMQEFVELSRGYEDKLKESERRLGEVLRHVEVSADKTERMVYLGMSNAGELVTNGAARKIAEIEEEKEGETHETEES